MIWKKVKGLVENGRYSHADGLIYWREMVLKSIFLIIIFIGIIPFLFSIVLAINTNSNFIIAANTVSYVSIVVLFLAKKISFYVKAGIIILIAYFVGVFLIFTMGPEANGLSYFIAASLLASLLTGLRGSIITLIVNIVLFTFIGIVLYNDLFSNLNISIYSEVEWITIASSTEMICLISSIPLAILLKGLDKTMSRQRELQYLLQEKITLLDHAKQKAEKADYMKTSFLANMSHEIRTPLNAIMGFTELLIHKMYSGEEEHSTYLNNIFKSGNYLLGIIKNILDFSIIESGQMKFSLNPFHINNLLKDLQHIYMSTMKDNSNVKLVFKETNYDYDSVINSDIDRIKQVLINLINNALKHTDKGEVNVGYERKGAFVEFQVIDTGDGIPEDKLKSVFERFVKVDGKNKIREGTGLGLPISKGIVNALGGEIWVNSEAGKGSTFYFTIPL